MLPNARLAFAEGEFCTYVDATGDKHEVGGLKQVPARYQQKATCGTTSLARPQDIELKGNIRVESITSNLGQITLRWPRIVETSFGKTPVRATVDAASAVSRAIVQGSFPSEVRRLNVPWDIVFMDDNLPSSQIPVQLITNCHPGWMVPPTNIYIAAERVAAGCSENNSRRATQVADKELASVLLHEFGHSVEFHMLKNLFAKDRLRAEGFAVWFSHYAASFTSLVSKQEIMSQAFALAKTHIQKHPKNFDFDGSPYAYGRASLYFHAIEKKFGVQGIMRVYSCMTQNRLEFFDAIKKELNWDRGTLEKEAKAIVG